MTDFTVDRVAFEGTWAVGVTARRGAARRGQEVFTVAGGETIISAALLQRHCIEVIADSGEVGRHLRDQRGIAFQFRVSHGSQNDQDYLRVADARTC
jgi:hypothetical protein